MSEAGSPRYTRRYGDALAFAAELHAKQLRKKQNNRDPDIPYVAHLLETSALVWLAGGDEDQAIAGLLHDALEDQYRPGLEDEIAERFGARVLAIVDACTDGDPTMSRDKDDWEQRKQAYLVHLAEAGSDALLVSLADKTSNVRAIVDDIEAGRDVFAIFSAPKDRTLWYYRSLSEVFAAQLGANIAVNRFAALVEQMHQLDSA